MAQTKMAIASLAFLTLAMSGLSTAHALASEAATEQVRARLLAESDAVYPGQSLLLGVQQRIIPHWHTYWRNSGDSGIPTKIEWQLPAGASAGEIHWPIPSRFNLGPITNYGYEKEVTLLSSVSVPADAKVGGVFPVQATVDWLVCEETCIPQQVQLGFELPIVATPAQISSTKQFGGELIEKALALLPVKSPWPVSVDYQNDRVTLRIANVDAQARIQDAWFYASRWGQVTHSAAQPRSFDGDTLVIELQPGEAPPATDKPLEGVLVLTEHSGNGTIARGFSIGLLTSSLVENHSVSGTAESRTAESRTAQLSMVESAQATAAITLPYALLFAFLGGVILNLMPCVFPVLSIKALSLLEQARQSPVQARLHGVAYTVGVLASFVLLAGVLLALRATGAQVGWGFQFQAPLFVLIVAYLMFAVGLSLSGVFFVGASLVGVGASLASRTGYAGSFFTGVLATVVATPCTAPFMGAALGYALSQPSLSLLGVFCSLGLGLAAPYLILSLWPAMQRRLPKPGAWMERVKQAFAFPMYATAVWLVWVLTQQVGPDATAIALSGMVAIAFAAWLYTNTRGSASRSRHLGSGVAAAAVLVALIGGYLGLQSRASAVAPAVANRSGEIGEPYSAARLQTLRAQGAPVFLNMTAAWCITCLVNERVALSDSAVIAAFKQEKVIYLKGDWTQRDAAITAILNQFGRSGVPLYVFYPQGTGSTPIVLPQILTPATVLSSIASTPLSST